jgi:hypothetical protein
MKTNNTLHLQKSCYIVNTAEDYSPFYTNSVTYFISNNLNNILKILYINFNAAVPNSYIYVTMIVCLMMAVQPKHVA